MAIQTFVFRTLMVVGMLGMVIGCTNPVAHPKEAPPPVKDGIDLDRTATSIAPDPSGKPYIVRLIKNQAGDTVAFDWVIPAGQTVTVAPGTVIMFDGLLWADVQGQLIADGTPNDPIVFTTARLEPDRGQWRSFKLTNTDPGRQSEFKYCVFSYGAYFDEDTLTLRGKDAQHYRGMMSIRNSSPRIENCTIVKNQNNGIFISNDGLGTLPMPQIRYNVVTDNDGAAVRTTDGVDLSQLNISYNCLGDNSIPAFLLFQTDSTFGHNSIVNANIDSTDMYYNLDRVPELVDKETGDYHLTSCSPCVDAGPLGSADPDNTRYDLGPLPYTQVAGELRGVWSGTLNSGITYRMSCHVRVPEDSTLVIPAGTHIETTGNYNLEVYGRLDVQGTIDSRVHICPCQAAPGTRWGGLRFLNYDTLSAPSEIHNADLMTYDEVDIYRKGVIFDGVLFDGGFNYGAAVLTNSLELADSVAFHDCRFNNCGLYGLRVDGSSAMIRNTLVESSKGRGISLHDVGAAVEITNTIARACSTSGIVADTLSSPLIVNVVLMNNGYHGLELIDNCNPVVMNSIIIGNHRYGILAQLSSQPQLSYNDVADNILANYSPGSLACDNCISLNPIFDGDGLHLGTGSPCIDAGNPDPQYNDADGSRNDQGAFGGPMGGGVGTARFFGSNRTVVMR